LFSALVLVERMALAPVVNSSKERYPGQFTDQKVAEARKELAETGTTAIFVYDNRTWDIKPPRTFSGE
jgi:hypothetical protein